MKNPEVDLQKGTLSWEESASVDMQALKAAIKNAGYEPK